MDRNIFETISFAKISFFQNHKRLFVEIYKMLLKKKNVNQYEITFEELQYTFLEIEALIFSLEYNEVIKFFSN